MPVQTPVNKVSGKPVPVLKSHASVRQFKLPKDGVEDSTGDLQQWFKRKQSVWPTDASSLYCSNEKDQMGEVIQILTTNDSQAANNLVEFSFKNKSFIPIELGAQNKPISLLEVEGTCLHIETQEAKIQLAGGSRTSLEANVVAQNENGDDLEDGATDLLKVGDDDESIEETEEDETKDSRCDKNDTNLFKGVSKTKKLMNQFNFCERATITYQNSLKDSGTVTKPPIRAIFSDYVTQWIIYDSYQEDTAIQEKEKEKGKKEKTAGVVKKIDFYKKMASDKKDIMNLRIVKKALILERMINQNMFSDILHDFRYYEDPSDEHRHNEGTLLPLWKFQYHTIKKLSVTDIKWSSRYYDLFALSFGSFDFQKQPAKGCFCLWSLKNPSVPEYISYTQSGVMTLDFHPTEPYLIVIGMHNGTVAVYDCRYPNKVPTHESNHVENKHKGTVWQVQWGEDLSEGEQTFFSISSDGNVFNWTLMQNQLIQTLVISLMSIQHPDMEIKDETGIEIKDETGIEIEDETGIEIKDENAVKDSGSCIALHPTENSIFLVGTEEGYIYKCSTEYLSMYLFVYEAHHMPVYRIDYNKFSSNIFASCSADWTIKVWEDERKEPLFVLDTNSSVEDVKWAPYSSTVIAAISLDCKTYIFDLNVNKYKSICMQTISSRKTSQLMKIAFNWKLPIIAVGDDKGIASVLKLSPNLRMKHKLTKKQYGIDLAEIEIQKLNKLLSLIREPSEMEKNSKVTTNTDSGSL